MRNFKIVLNNPNVSLTSETSKIMIINKTTKEQILITTENEFNASIITCNNTVSYIPVLFFQKSNETKIYEENNHHSGSNG